MKYSYFMEMRKDEGGAFYHPIQNQMKLKKRRILVLVIAEFRARMMSFMRKIIRNLRGLFLNTGHLAKRKKERGKN